MRNGIHHQPGSILLHTQSAYLQEPDEQVYYLAKDVTFSIENLVYIAIDGNRFNIST